MIETFFIKTDGQFLWKGEVAFVLSRNDTVEIRSGRYRVVYATIERNVQKVMVSSRASYQPCFYHVN